MANANIYCTGPVHVFARIPATGPGPRNATSGGNAFYLGTCREYPKLGIEPKYKQIFNDLSGDEVAFDAMFMGEDGMVELDMNRFDYAAMQNLTNVPRMARSGVNGSTTRLDRGAMVLGNKLGYELWLKFSFYNTANSADYPELIPGFYFYSCMTVGNFPDPIGTRDQSVRLMVKPMNWWQAATGSFSLYSNDPAAFAPVNAIPIT